MFYAINSATGEKVNSLTLQTDISYAKIDEEIWYADPDEIESCPEDLDVHKIETNFRRGNKSIINFKGTEYAVSPHFFIPNKNKLGINTVPESKEHKLAKNWIYNCIVNKKLSVAYSEVSKPYKYKNIVDLFDLSIDYKKIGIETSSSTFGGKARRKADVICPFIVKHPLLGNGIVFEIQFSKQRKKTTEERSIDWALRGYSIAWVFDYDFEYVTDLIIKLKDPSVKVSSFQSLLRLNGKSCIKNLSHSVETLSRNIELKKQGWKDELFENVMERVEERMKQPTTKTITQPICPQCKIPMLLRKNMINGNKFWGCSNYPRCGCTMSHEED